jgi:hypothetical protein
MASLLQYARNGSGTLLNNASSNDIFDHYKLTHPLLSSSHKHNINIPLTPTCRSPHLTNRTLLHLSYKYPNFSFLQMIPDLNFDLSDEGNYTVEEPSGSSFFARIFSNHDQS